MNFCMSGTKDKVPHTNPQLLISPSAQRTKLLVCISQHIANCKGFGWSWDRTVSNESTQKFASNLFQYLNGLQVLLKLCLGRKSLSKSRRVFWVRTTKLGLFWNRECYCTENFFLPMEVNIGAFLMRVYPLQPELLFSLGRKRVTEPMHSPQEEEEKCGS